ncbi:MAG: arginine--tRNA ligase [Hyphomicrobiales bacterium]
MNIFSLFQERVVVAAHALSIDGVDWANVDFSRVVVEPPRDAAHGDLATNVAMVLAKPLGLKPRDLAEQLAEQLRLDGDVAEVSVAGPGFVNIRLNPSFWVAHLAEILKAGQKYGANYVETPRKVNVEYVSANPTGPMHVGHCRGAVVGDVIANLLSFAGHEVTKEYYINDAGVQIDVLSRSVHLRYREALGENIGEIPEGLYPGDYLKPIAAKLAEEHGEALKNMSEAEWLPIIRDAAIDAMMELIREDLAQLNVRHDAFFSERTLHAARPQGSSLIDETLASLASRDLIYVGTLPPPKGQLPEDWEDRPQTLLRATDFGDDIDRPLKKSDGDYTYFAADVAYFRDKYERGFQDMLYILGADHGGYVKRLGAVAKAIAGDEAKLSVLLCQLVKLMREGEPVKMSKRSGNLVTLRDVVEEVGRDAVRFMMLYRKSDAPLDFDFAKVTEQSKDNPVFYVQYAHARAHSVFKMAEDRAGIVSKDWDAISLEGLNRLEHKSEIALIQKMAAFPRILETAVDSKEPHRIAFYLYELASSFHSHWNIGKDQPDLRFINDNDRELTCARLAMVSAVSNVIAAGLSIMGVSAPQEMR